MKILDFLQRLEIEEKARKTKELFKNSVVSSFPKFFLIISFLTAVEGIVRFRIDPTGFVHKSFNNIPSDNAVVTLVRKPLQGIDTIITDVQFDQWATVGNNFVPELTGQDTLWSYVIKDTLGREFYATTFLTGGGRNPLEVCLIDPNKPGFFQTIQIKNVIDTSNIASDFYGYFWLKKNPSQVCTANVDTTLNPLHIVDWYINTQSQDSSLSQGDSGYVVLEKIYDNWRYFTKIGFEIDTTYINAMQVKSQGNTGNDTIYFPLEKEHYPGVGEEDLEKKVRETNSLVIKPNPTQGNIILNQKSDFFLYNTLGTLVYKGKGKDIDLDKLNLPAGAYYLKSKDNELIKVIYLK